MNAPIQFTKELIIKDGHLKKDGTAELHIYISVNGQEATIPLNLYWEPTYFNKKAGTLKPRKRNDPDRSDYTILIEMEFKRLNEILIRYRLNHQPITLNVLLEEYYSYSSKLDFLDWWDNELEYRRSQLHIEPSTAKGHRTSLNKLRKFWQEENKTTGRKRKLPALTFNQLTPRICENFSAWLKADLGNAPNTVEKDLSRLRTYVRRALVAKIKFEDPFKIIKIRPQETYPNVLEQEQLHQLLDLYEQPDIAESWKKVLQHFLFSCFTGLRISDIKTVTYINLKGDWLELIPRKTKRLHKVVRIPLHPLAQRFLLPATGPLFDTYCDHYTNRKLGEIGVAIGLDWRITTHTARHTFGTIFIELGGDIVTLKEYMGHASIKTTMRYIHLSERRKFEKIRVFDKLFINRNRP